MMLRPPRSTLFPYAPLFRAKPAGSARVQRFVRRRSPGPARGAHSTHATTREHTLNSSHVPTSNDLFRKTERLNRPNRVGRWSKRTKPRTFVMHNWVSNQN